MSRTLFYYDNATGERRDHVDISTKNPSEIFSIEYQMLLKCEGTWIVVDSDDEKTMMSLRQNMQAA